jgi:hypothetical protein
VQKLLFLGSTCIYPKFAKQPMSEDQLLTGETRHDNEHQRRARSALAGTLARDPIEIASDRFVPLALTSPNRLQSRKAGLVLWEPIETRWNRPHPSRRIGWGLDRARGVWRHGPRQRAIVPAACKYIFCYTARSQCVERKKWEVLECRAVGSNRRRVRILFLSLEARLRIVGALLIERNDEWTVQPSMTLETIALLSDDPGVSL